jgi:hypothetical protein
VDSGISKAKSYQSSLDVYYTDLWSVDVVIATDKISLRMRSWIGRGSGLGADWTIRQLFAWVYAWIRIDYAWIRVR